jgi:hypothetical protein
MWWANGGKRDPPRTSFELAVHPGERRLSHTVLTPVAPGAVSCAWNRWDYSHGVALQVEPFQRSVAVSSMEGQQEGDVKARIHPKAFFISIYSSSKQEEIIP